jgi:hypothetical protein
MSGREWREWPDEPTDCDVIIGDAGVDAEARCPRLACAAVDWPATVWIASMLAAVISSDWPPRVVVDFVASNDPHACALRLARAVLGVERGCAGSAESIDRDASAR